MAYHLVRRSLRGTLAFRTHSEARALWDRLLKHVPDPLALCLMPDHVHLLHRRDVTAGLGKALESYAKWRNAERGQGGRAWQVRSAPESVEGRVKLRRSIRYIHLNPCRAGLVDDPLGWAWSTHRDACGLALPPMRTRVPDPVAFHGWVSADPTVHVSGTSLPTPTLEAPPEAISEAVFALTRTPGDLLQGRGAARALLVRSLRCLSGWTPSRIASWAGLHRATVHRASDVWTPEIRVVALALTDRRFPALQSWDLAQTRPWARYRGRR